MEIHTGTESRVEAAELKSTFTVCPAVPSPPPSFYFALSLSIQRNMYNYKGYKKGSNINRQKYTELIFTCLLNVRKSSYAHTEVKKIKTKRKQKECRVTFRYL